MAQDSGPQTGPQNEPASKHAFFNFSGHVCVRSEKQAPVRDAHICTCEAVQKVFRHLHTACAHAEPQLLTATAAILGTMSIRGACAQSRAHWWSRKVDHDLAKICPGPSPQTFAANSERLRAFRRGPGIGSSGVRKGQAQDVFKHRAAAKGRGTRDKCRCGREGGARAKLRAPMPPETPSPHRQPGRPGRLLLAAPLPSSLRIAAPLVFLTLARSGLPSLWNTLPMARQSPPAPSHRCSSQTFFLLPQRPARTKGQSEAAPKTLATEVSAKSQAGQRTCSRDLSKPTPQRSTLNQNWRARLKL